MKGISNPIKIPQINKIVKQNKYQEWLLKIIATLTIICTTVYGIHDLLFYLFDSVLGNLFLIFIIIIIGLNNIFLGIFTCILLIVLYVYHKNYNNNNNNKIKEGFKWTQDEIQTFISVQKTAAPIHVYDVETLQKHVSPEELHYYFKNGKWPWSEETKTRYQNALDTNPFVRVYKKGGLTQTQRLFNEYAINYILDNQEKSKKMNEIYNKKKKPPLPSGFGDFGYNAGLITHYRI
jgi:hypothetical protein